MDRQVFAFSGVLSPRPGEPGNLPLLEHVLDLGRTRCRAPSRVPP